MTAVLFIDGGRTVAVLLMQTVKRLNDGNGAAALSCMQDCGWWWLTVTLRRCMTDDGGAAAARRTMCYGVTAAVRGKYG